MVEHTAVSFIRGSNLFVLKLAFVVVFMKVVPTRSSGLHWSGLQEGTARTALGSLTVKRMMKNGRK